MMDKAVEMIIIREAKEESPLYFWAKIAVMVAAGVAVESTQMPRSIGVKRSRLVASKDNQGIITRRMRVP